MGSSLRPLPHLKSDEVADVLQIAKTRILKAFARLGAVEVMPDALAVDDAWTARDPVMAHLAAAAVDRIDYGQEDLDGPHLARGLDDVLLQALALHTPVRTGCVTGVPQVAKLSLAC